MNKKLLIIGIVLVGVIVAVFFVTAEIYKEEIEADQEKANVNNPFLPYAALFLFGIPPSVAAIIASFFKSTKTKIIILCAITGASYIAIFVIAIMMLDYPSMFGIPEDYWETE